jgi:disulfide bond formation protein DsbB
MIYSISILLLSIIIFFTGQSEWLRYYILALGFIGMIVSIIEFNKGWHIGFNAFMIQFSKSADLSVVRDLFRKETLKKMDKTVKKHK